MSERYRVGGDCDAWCTRCKMDLAHTIVAMVDGKPVQVKCNTCDGFHRYRAPKSGAKATVARAERRSKSRSGGASKGTRRTGSVGLSAKEREWEAAIEAHAGATPRAYVPNRYFAPDEIMDHPKFGRGVVTAAPAPKRVKVLFRDGERTMVCAAPPKDED